MCGAPPPSQSESLLARARAVCVWRCGRPLRRLADSPTEYVYVCVALSRPGVGGPPALVYGPALQVSTFPRNHLPEHPKKEGRDPTDLRQTSSLNREPYDKWSFVMMFGDLNISRDPRW